MIRQLMPHQQRAFEYAKKYGRIALFLEMRLGKTLVAIRWAEFNERKRVLVVAPLPVVRVWREELLDEKYAEEDIQVIRGDEEKKITAATSPATWFLINYEGLLSMPELLGAGWDCIILDESTRIRNPQAKITKLLNSSCQMIPQRAILSGLPAPESILDYFEQLRFLHGTFLGFWNYWVFRGKMFQQVGYTYVCSKFVREKIKEVLDEYTFMLTRKEAGFKDRKVYEKRYVPLNAVQKKLMKQIEDGFAFETPEGVKEETKWAPVTYLWQAMVAGGFAPDGTQISNAKCEEILDLLRGELKGEPVVIWFRFDWELQAAVKFFKEKKFSVGKFCGGDKEDALAFEKGDLQLLCSQGKCGAFGLNWSISSTVIYYSNWPDGEIRQQTEDRVVDVKKDTIKLFMDLVTEGSLDEDVVDILRNKKVESREFFRKLRIKWSKRTT